MDSTVIGDGRSLSPRASSLPLYIYTVLWNPPEKDKKIYWKILEIYFSELLDTLKRSLKVLVSNSHYVTNGAVTG